MVDLVQLIAQYKGQRSSMSEKQKAEAERRLWEAYCSSIGPDVNRGARHEWFGKVLDESSRTYEHRQMMLAAGPWVDPLWEMLDQGHSLYSIVNLFRQARDLSAKDQIPHDQATRRVLDEYNNMGYVARSSDGKLHRRMTPTERARTAPPPSQPDLDFSQLTTQNSKSKKFLLQLALLTDHFLQSCVEDLDGDHDPIILKLAHDEFVSFIREAAEDLKRRVNFVRSSVRKEGRKQKVSREQFRHACEVLNLPYQYGQKVDLRFCKRTMLKRAAPLHPDRNGGRDSARAEYQAVIESYGTLEKYMEGLSNEIGERSHEGR